MPPFSPLKQATRRLRELSGLAWRGTEAEFLAGGDGYLYGGFAWEWLRNRPGVAFSLDREAALLGRGGKGLDLFCRALDKRWTSRRPAFQRRDALLGASAILRSALPEDFWLPIEADIPLVVLSPTYREMRIRAYNRDARILAPSEADPKKPRWQPYLNSVAIAAEQRLCGLHGVMAASWAIHELSHVILMTAPPADDELPIPRRYVRWLLGQEGKTIAIESRISEEVRFRMPHPFFTGLFNTPSFRDGFEAVTKVRELSRLVLRAWIDLSRYASPPRVPGRRALRALQTTDEFAVGSLVYALTNRAVFTCGSRAELLRRLLPEPRLDRDAARGLEKEATPLVTERSALDSRARSRARRFNETAVRAFRAAELHDFLSVLPGGSPKAVSSLRSLFARLTGRPAAAHEIAAADTELRSILRRQLPILSAFGFDARYADGHPSLFEISA